MRPPPDPETTLGYSAPACMPPLPPPPLDAAYTPPASPPALLPALALPADIASLVVFMTRPTITPPVRAK